MAKKFSVRASMHAKGRQQAQALLLFGVVLILAAWLLHPDPGVYPIGVLLLGVGMLIAALLNPARLMAAGWLISLLGLAVFLFFRRLIPPGEVFPVYIIAIGLGLLAIALMARRGYVGVGAVTPAILVLVIGIVEYLLLDGRTPPNFVSFMLSLWLPGIGLLALGLLYLLAGEIAWGRKRRDAPKRSGRR